VCAKAFGAKRQSHRQEQREHHAPALCCRRRQSRCRSANSSSASPSTDITRAPPPQYLTQLPSRCHRHCSCAVCITAAGFTSTTPTTTGTPRCTGPAGNGPSRRKTGVSIDHASLSCSEGHSDMVTVLLEAGADPNLKNKDENTPLHVAAAEGREDVVKRLVQKGADVAALNKQRWQPSHWAAAGGHSSVLKQLVLSGADLHATTSTGHTCLHLCSASGSPTPYRAIHTAF
jgi:hypothetical protein